MPRLEVGDVVHRTLPTAWGDDVRVPDPSQLVHLQFRRYAGCPVCNLHLRSLARRSDEIAAAGVHEVVVFHSTPEAIGQYQDDLPFPVVADPDRELYREFGVEAAPRAVLDPRTWLAAARGAYAMRTLRGAVERNENHLGLPADFLVDTSGKIVARKYGTHANDQWTVDELLRIVQGATRSAAE